MILDNIQEVLIMDALEEPFQQLKRCPHSIKINLKPRSNDWVL